MAEDLALPVRVKRTAVREWLEWEKRIEGGQEFSVRIERVLVSKGHTLETGFNDTDEFRVGLFIRNGEEKWSKWNAGKDNVNTSAGVLGSFESIPAQDRTIKFIYKLGDKGLKIAIGRYFHTANAFTVGETKFGVVRPARSSSMYPASSITVLLFQERGNHSTQ